MRVADYVMQRLSEAGVKHFFLLTGGMAMHLNDALGLRKEIAFVCNLHEQACAIAAEAYAKYDNRLGALMVTGGPGATNAITGVAGGWLDSSPMIVISGQVKRADLKGDSGVRNRGVQEIDIVPMVRSITKYAATITDPSTVRLHLEKAIHLALSGRPGPVWIDIPLDVQASQVEPEKLSGFTPEERTPELSHCPKVCLFDRDESIEKIEIHVERIVNLLLPFMHALLSSAKIANHCLPYQVDLEAVGTRA
jgi:acetolactate synthase-1/2/3 large subunit